MSLVYIYGLVDPRNQELRYIGKTENLSLRYQDHLRLRKNSYKNNWIKQILNSGMKPDIFVIEETTDENWPEDERFWISYFKYIGCNLTNKHEGGFGGLYGPMTEEHRRKIGDALRGKKRGPLSEEHRKKIGDASRGKKRPNGLRGRKFGPMTEERKRNISIAKTGKKINRRIFHPLSEEHKKKLSQSLMGRPSPTKGRKMGPLSNEHKEKISRANTGRVRGPLSDEQKERLRFILSGRKRGPMPEETKRKLSESKKKSYQERMKKKNVISSN